ncbi:hypothetical protein JCM8097_001305 [Rhodosporidiobolus ruineniae]
MAAPAKLVLKKLSNAVYYAEPAVAAGLNGSKAGAGGAKAPELVLVAAWMGAQLKHVEKYLRNYQDLYPSASILLLRSNERDFYSFRNHLPRLLEPAVEVVNKHAGGVEAGPSSPVLVHVFSNGGCATLKELNELLKRSSPRNSTAANDDKKSLLPSSTSCGVPARAIVFDSCPGHSTLQTTLKAFTAGIRNRFLRVPAMAFFTVVYGVMKLVDFIRRRPPVLTRLSLYLNSPSFPSVPRLYLYSEADELVPFTDVEHHAAEAKKRGVEVKTVRFEGTPHVAHARAEPERYWGAVKTFWEEAGMR